MQLFLLHCSSPPPSSYQAVSTVKLLVFQLGRPILQMRLRLENPQGTYRSWSDESYLYGSVAEAAVQQLASQPPCLTRTATHVETLHYYAIHIICAAGGYGCRIAISYAQSLMWISSACRPWRDAQSAADLLRYTHCTWQRSRQWNRRCQTNCSVGEVTFRK